MINTISYLNYQISYLNSLEFKDLKREIFTHHLYYFETDLVAPLIIDAGAHIGLATLYFKYLYPQAKILAFEPNLKNFSLLENNIAQNHLTDVTLIPKALHKHQGKATFYADKTDFSWLSTSSFHQKAWDGSQQTQALTVETVRLGSYLQQFSQIDFLKMDIEGAETMVLLSLGEEIKKIKQLIFEFHPTKDQRLKELLAFLEKKGFTYRLKNHHNQTVKTYNTKNLVLVEAENSRLV